MSIDKDGLVPTDGQMIKADGRGSMEKLGRAGPLSQ
jgi:hypothetical protein